MSLIALTLPTFSMECKQPYRIWKHHQCTGTAHTKRLETLKIFGLVSFGQQNRAISNEINFYSYQPDFFECRAKHNSNLLNLDTNQKRYLMVCRPLRSCLWAGRTGREQFQSGGQRRVGQPSDAPPGNAVCLPGRGQWTASELDGEGACPACHQQPASGAAAAAALRVAA